MVASHEGQVECVKTLLDMGAKVDIYKKVSCVTVHWVHAMQHIPRVPSSG